ncbi:HHK1, histidine kinase-group X protein [Bisporella sp. PMI_857]|nr:HHK1, histidine kinase-group X protein [Bisporella sp. PMI_857]
MDDTVTLETRDENLDPPARLFERLRQIAGYSWEESQEPIHSSYDTWQVFGTRYRTERERSATAEKGAPIIPTSDRSLSSPEVTQGIFEPPGWGSDCGSEIDNALDDLPNSQVKVVAKVSTHALREERAFHICKNLTKSVDPDGTHIVRPIDILRLTPMQSDKGTIIVCIFEHPGENYLQRIIDFGAAWYKSHKAQDKQQAFRDEFIPKEVVPLETFLDFAVGAVECLEILHHGQRIVHGEIRGDAFHMNKDTGQVRLVSFGSGLRTFEHGLTSTGWSALSKEIGAKTKLAYMSPEQTGRMPAEPDTRTDIYSLGILFWSMLTQQAAFDGETPMDIIQGVLGRRLPPVFSIRMDIPDVISRIIQKMTAKTIGDRYNSASGLRHDLIEVRALLGAGNSEALKNWKIATKDVSSFFILPAIMVGRQLEHDDVVKVIDRVSKRHTNASHQGLSLSSGSLSEERLDILNAVAGSDGDNTGSAERMSTSLGKPNSHLANAESVSHTISDLISAANSQHNSMSIHSNTSGRYALKPLEKNTSLSLTSGGMSSSFNQASEDVQQSSSDGVGSLASQGNRTKFRRKGRCEVISISGAAGLGKSCLVHSVQVEARRRGYFASAKFDQAKKTAFGPVLKLLSSLFQQVFSETNTDTSFHQLLKQYVRPGWGLLHKVLGLPEFLLGPPPKGKSDHKNRASQGFNKAVKSEHRRRDSSPQSSRSGSIYNMALGATSSQEFLRSGTSTKSVRLMNTFLDVLRVFTQHKFICFCLDDLQFADDESLDMITQIIASRMKMIIIVTYRPDEILPEKIRGVIELQGDNTEEHVKFTGLGVTQINLRPLSEEDIVQYVAATLCRPADEIIPLAAVIQSKTAGNPFYMREMLDTCHRKQGIWHDHRESRWLYDLDRVFEIFETKSYHDILNSEFINSRLGELPPASRAIIAWGSLVGSTFSFALIQKLLSNEFVHDDSRNLNDNIATELASIRYSQQDIVEGLQAAIQAFVIVPTQDDDRFRFAHDRFMNAAASFREGQKPVMHFVIAQTLLKYFPSHERYRDTVASHICESIKVIKTRVMHRHAFRKLLFDCAQTAAENGARPTTAKYYAACFSLLQDKAWNDGTDAYYEETLELHIRAAECYLYMGNMEEANRLLATIFDNARTPVDKSPAWVLQSRILTQEGDLLAAFKALRRCLAALDVSVDDSPSFEKCDSEFERLSLKIQSLDKEALINRGVSKDSNLNAVGAVLVETISAALWSDTLTFYEMSLVMVNTQVTLGNFPQAGMAFLHLGIIAITRFNMISFASEMGKISLALMDLWQDNYFMGRGGSLYSHYLGHVQIPLQESVAQLEGALEYAMQAGDRTTTILNFGLIANLRFFASDPMTQLEAFCTYGCEELPGWEQDTRGGTMVLSIRQVTRAVQGKTFVSKPEEIMSDGQHNSIQYKLFLRTSMKDPDRSLLFYEGIEICPLFLYGHYSAAVELGKVNLNRIEKVWSVRTTRFLMFFYGLSLAGVAWDKLQDPVRSVSRTQRSTLQMEQSEARLHEEVEDTVKTILSLKRKIEDWQIVNDINYLAWSKLLAAQIAEMKSDHGAALKNYEEALDHAAVHNFVFEEALGNYLLAGFFLRAGSRRSAKAALREAIMLYRQIDAIGIVKYIETQHNLLLQDPTRNMRTADISVQTDFAGDSAEVQYATLEGDESDLRQQTKASVTETKEQRIGAWQGGSARPPIGSAISALDMLDLTSILESSQVISSVLQVDQLLKTMCEIILQNCGGLASTAAIVVEEDEPVGWSIAASGDSEKGAQAHIPGIPLQETALVAEGVILYCTRFRETVFLPDLTRDERFSNVTEAWSARNPKGKSVIGIPIRHGDKPLLGVLYLEGQPNAFTDRNLTVLQLLVNQIGISYSNALTLKDIEKVSAFNNAMVDMQKKALQKALNAEKQANQAKAEAIHNVKLAEEAAKAKSIFLANVSHELRTPLNGVIGNSELLRDSNLRKDQAEMADSIRVSADLLLTVINDILDFSKMEADKMKLFIVAFNADEMIREVVRSVSYSNSRSKDVQIIQDIQLPQVLVFGDPVRLHQVLGNLIGNSLKFTEKGSVTIGAKADWETEVAVKLTFWVKDTGIGIPPQQLAKLFTPFSQADASTARKYGGSGLGLSICKSLIESMMGGSIQLESAENEGTTAWFSVTLPKADAEASAGDIQTGSSISSQPSLFRDPDSGKSTATYDDFSQIPREQIRICIAEDNPINQKIAIQFMQKLGFNHVDAYDNGLLAVEALRQKALEGEPYHIILMDVQMPVLDGYEATKLLRRDKIDAVRRILVIAMTASAIQGDREKCLASGMNDYLAKPVRSGVLKKKLDQYFLQPPLSLTNVEEEAKKVATDVISTTARQETASPLKLLDIATSEPQENAANDLFSITKLANSSQTNDAYNSDRIDSLEPGSYLENNSLAKSRTGLDGSKIPSSLREKRSNSVIRAPSIKSGSSKSANSKKSQSAKSDDTRNKGR